MTWHSPIGCGVSFESSWWARFHGSAKTYAYWVWHSLQMGELCVILKNIGRLQNKIRMIKQTDLHDELISSGVGHQVWIDAWKPTFYLSQSTYHCQLGYRQSSWTSTILAWKCTPLSQSQLSFSFKESCDWLRAVYFHAKIIHVQDISSCVVSVLWT